MAKTDAKTKDVLEMLHREKTTPFETAAKRILGARHVYRDHTGAIWAETPNGNFWLSPDETERLYDAIWQSMLRRAQRAVA